jgi:hypothetical protein
MDHFEMNEKGETLTKSCGFLVIDKKPNEATKFLLLQVSESGLWGLPKGHSHKGKL